MSDAVTNNFQWNPITVTVGLSICLPSCRDSLITEISSIKMFINLSTTHINRMRYWKKQWSNKGAQMMWEPWRHGDIKTACARREADCWSQCKGNRARRAVPVLFSWPCCYFTHMAEGFGQWREVDLASGQNWALAWAEQEEEEVKWGGWRGLVGRIEKRVKVYMALWESKRCLKSLETH